MKRKLSMILAVVIMLSAFAAPACAMEKDFSRISDYFKSCTAHVTKESSTSLSINYSVTAKSSMAQLGATTIYLFCDGEVVASYTYARYPVMCGSNVRSYTNSITYTGASSGHTYYAQVFFQATDADGSGSDYCYTNSITF